MINFQVASTVRRNIGDALIWQIAESSHLNIGGEAQGHVSNTLVYTWTKSFHGFNTDGSYQNSQSAKLKSMKSMCYTVC